MPVNTVSDAKPGPARRDLFIVLFCLLAVLGMLFHRSFNSDDVLFSNDGPLGAVKAQADYHWKNLAGIWQDLNWLGGKQLGGFLSLNYFFFGVLGPLLYSKFIAPISLLVLGLSAWLLFRQLG